MKDHDQIKELLPGFALGCLDPEEAASVSEHLASCATCRAEVRAYEQTAGLLAFGSPPAAPSPALKSKLMARVRATASTHLNSRLTQYLNFVKNTFRPLSPAGSIAGLLVILSLSLANIVQWQRANDTVGQASGPMMVVKMKGSEHAPNADGTFVIGQDNRHGVLVASDLPESRADQQYQLWLQKDGKYTSAGTFTPTPNGYGVMAVQALVPLVSYQSFEVTLEPFGGSPTPSLPRLMTGHF